MNLISLTKAFDFSRRNAENQSGLRLREGRRFRSAVSTVNKVPRRAAARSDNRQTVGFNRNFRPSFVWFVHKLNKVFRLRQVILAVPEAPTFRLRSVLQFVSLANFKASAQKIPVMVGDFFEAIAVVGAVVLNSVTKA